MREALSAIRRAARLRDYGLARDAALALNRSARDNESASRRVTEALELAGMSRRQATALRCWFLEEDAGPFALEAGAREILFSAVHLTEHVDAAEQALIDEGFRLYVHGGRIVRLGYRDRKADGREELCVEPIDEAHIRELMGLAAQWKRWDARSTFDLPAGGRQRGEWISTGCPAEVAKTYIARGAGHWRLPVLTGIITAPALRRDGTLITAPGWDEETGLYLDIDDEWLPDACDPSMPEDEPGAPQVEDDSAWHLDRGRGTLHRWGLTYYPQEEAERALDVLDELLAGFPFAGEEGEACVDHSVAVAAILTAVLRHALPAAPMVALTAPAPGSGKSYFVDVISLIATGRRASGFSWSSADEENRKQLDAALLAGSSHIALDNVTEPLGGDRLNQILTQQRATVRVLGQSKIVEVPCHAFVTANGNNLAIAADMTRRTLLCRLDSGLERPENREFSSDPVALIEQDRGRFVKAALRILRLYHLAGRPVRPQPLGSFEAWSAWVRGAVIWVTGVDPVDSMNTVRDDDPIRTADLAALETWAGVFGDRRVSSAQIIAAASSGQHPGMREAFLQVAGTAGCVNTDRLGKWVRRVKGRPIGGFRVEPAGVSRGVRHWRLSGGVHAVSEDGPPLEGLA